MSLRPVVIVIIAISEPRPTQLVKFVTNNSVHCNTVPEQPTIAVSQQTARHAGNRMLVVQQHLIHTKSFTLFMNTTITHSDNSMASIDRRRMSVSHRSHRNSPFLTGATINKLSDISTDSAIFETLEAIIPYDRTSVFHALVMKIQQHYNLFAGNQCYSTPVYL